MHKLSDARPLADCTTGPPTCTATHRRSPFEARARPGGDPLLRMASPTLILASWVRHGLAVSGLVNLRVSGRARVGWGTVDGLGSLRVWPAPTTPPPRLYSESHVGCSTRPCCQCSGMTGGRDLFGGRVQCGLTALLAARGPGEVHLWRRRMSLRRPVGVRPIVRQTSSSTLTPTTPTCPQPRPDSEESERPSRSAQAST